MRRKKTGILVFFLLAGAVLYGQENVITLLPRWMVHGSVGVSVPQGYMTRYIDEPDFAVYLEGLYRIRENHPVLVGLSTFRTTFQQKTVKYEDWFDGSLIRIRERTASRFTNVGGNIRFQPEINWLLQPYLQGQVGWHYIYTNTKFRDRDENETIEILNEQRASRLGYGIQAGVQYVPNAWYGRIDFRVSYFSNPAADFMALDSNPVSDVPIEQFALRNAPISLLFFHLGGSYLF